MKIISGCARGVELASLDGQSGVRPTIGRAREALFNALGDLSGQRVLDLFAGSGALGLEAASRGAAAVTLVELEPARVRVIEENIARVRRAGAPGDIRLAACDATMPERYLAPGDTFDTILADPPYETSFSAFSRLAAGGEEGLFPAFPGALIVWELPDAPGGVGPFIELVGNRGAEWRLRKFGATSFLWLRS